MPRLIPQLLRNLEHVQSLPPKSPRITALKTRSSDSSTKPFFTRPDEVDISPTGRSRSILLDRHAVRLIYRHARYERSKEAAPKIRVSQPNSEAKRRAMTLEERRFWANPYLRMLGSPLRKCCATDVVLPRDLLIGMAAMLLPGGRDKAVFLPSRIEHPAFRHDRGGRTRYVLCCKSAVEHVRSTGSFRRWKPENSADMPMHALVAQQIGHSLRVRILQELQVLARQLRRRQQPSSPPLLRRLTRAEWNEVKSTGVVPLESAVAILVVPLVNKDPETKERPTPNMTSMPTKEDLEPSRFLEQRYPLSALYPTTTDKMLDEGPFHILPPAQVPVYNGVPLFPSRTQRAALHLALSQVLDAERRAKDSQRHETLMSAQGDQKASHAFLVCSDANTVLRGDTVPLAIALWRLRMWEAREGDKDTPINWVTSPLRTP